MINNNLDINLNSTVSLNSINYKSNQHRELDKIHPKMLQWDGVVMMVMKVLVVMMMMIPMKPSSMTMMMATISPSGKEFPWQISACRRAFSLCVFSAPQRRWSLSVIPLILGFWGDDIREGAMAEVGQGGHTTRWHGLGLACATRWCGPLLGHLALSFWLLPSSGKI
jgi:hypothetical protein